MNNNIQKACTADKEEFKSLISKLDDIGTQATIILMAYLADGASNEEAVNASNQFLVANGKNPVAPLHSAT